MKVVAYSAKAFEKEYLARFNDKKHDITLISNRLSLETIEYALDKHAVLVFTSDDVSAPVVNLLADMGVKYIATRSTGTDHIDINEAQKRGVKIANVTAYSPQAIAEHAVSIAMCLNRRLIRSNDQSHKFNFQLDGLTGFNFHGKTVGIIGLGNVGLATAAIYKGLGCRILGYDIQYPKTLHTIIKVNLNELISESDIISLHVPLTTETKYMIGTEEILAMKPGVMLINTARGALVNTEAALLGIVSGKIGYLGMDVYENEKNLFFEDHSDDEMKDLLLEKLLTFPNVLITPHQAFLTSEALAQIAKQTIKNLDAWAADDKKSRAVDLG